MPNKTNTKNDNSSNLPLVIILAICLVVLSVLMILVLQKFQPTTSPSLPVVNTDPEAPQDPIGEKIELVNIEDMSLTQLTQALESNGVEYEIIPTNSKMANRVEKIEGYTVDEDGKIIVNYGEKITIHSNIVDQDKIIYLTFDDGPMVNYSNSALTDIYYTTRDLLDVLDRYNVKATFFLAGYQMVKSDRVHFVNEIYEKGHIIASHTYSHDFNTIYNSTSHFIDDVKKFENALINILGEGTYNSIDKFIRFPGGSSTNGILSNAKAKQFIEAIQNEGYKVYDWTTLTGDAEGVTTTQGMINYMKQSINTAKNKNEPLILLMHDKKLMTDSLPAILDYLIGEGYYFDTIDNCPEYTFV